MGKVFIWCWFLAVGQMLDWWCFYFTVLPLFLKMEAWFAGWWIEAAPPMAMMDTGAPSLCQDHLVPPSCNPTAFKSPFQGGPFCCRWRCYWFPKGNVQSGWTNTLIFIQMKRNRLNLTRAICHMAFDWWGTDSSGMGGLSLALSVSAGALRDRGYRLCNISSNDLEMDVSVRTFFWKD